MNNSLEQRQRKEVLQPNSYSYSYFFRKLRNRKSFWRRNGVFPWDEHVAGRDVTCAQRERLKVPLPFQSTLKKTTPYGRVVPFMAWMQHQQLPHNLRLKRYNAAHTRTHAARYSSTHITRTRIARGCHSRMEFQYCGVDATRLRRAPQCVHEQTNCSSYLGKGQSKEK